MIIESGITDKDVKYDEKELYNQIRDGMDKNENDTLFDKVFFTQTDPH